MYTLIAHRAWEVVTGDEVEPKAPDFYSDVEEDRYKKELNTFRDRTSKAISIMYAALAGTDHLPHIAGINDPKQMWEKIRDVFDISLNPPVLYKLHEVFHAEKFGLRDTVVTWTGRLQGHVRKLASSDWPIDSRDVVHKLIRELPVKYEVVRQLLYQQNPRELQIEAVRRVLQTSESQKDQKPAPQPGPKKPPATPRPGKGGKGKGKAKKGKPAKPTQAKKQAPINASNGRNDKVVESRVEKILQKEKRRCTICGRPNHTEANYFSREQARGPNRATSAMNQVMYQETMYPPYREGSQPSAFYHPPQEPYGHVGLATATGGFPVRGTPNPVMFEEQPQHYYHHQGYGYYY